MLVNCPNCTAAYDVPDRLLEAGPRRMKCAKCGHQFSAALSSPGNAGLNATMSAAPKAESPPAPDAAVKPPEAATAPTPTAPTPPSALRSTSPAASATKLAEVPPTPAKRDRLALLGWGATLLLLLGAGGFVWANHAAIAQAWPPAERLFAQIGLR